jgi:ABC-type dipeptide/oligopeptide/nickel transport system permease component
MRALILHRLLHSVPVAVGVVFLSFALLHMTASDPARVVAGPDATAELVAEIRRDMQLDQPLQTQFLGYVERLLKGDMGKSLINSQPVAQEVGGALLPTLELMFAAMLWSIPLGIVMGVVAATHRGSWVDRTVMLVAITGLSMPTFAVGMFLIQFFALMLGWLPIQGRGGPLWTLEGLRHVVLPAISLGFLMLGPVARLMRASTLETLNSDFVRTARAKGIPERRVIAAHAVPNSLTAVITVVGLLVGVLLGSAVVIENVFSWPGLGRLASTAIAAGDLPLATGCILVLALSFIVINTVVDLACSLMDPRLRLR